MTSHYRAQMIRQGVDLHLSATKIETAMRVLQAHDGVCSNTHDELREAARAINRQAIDMIETHGGDATQFRNWEANAL